MRSASIFNVVSLKIIYTIKNSLSLHTFPFFIIENTHIIYSHFFKHSIQHLFQIPMRVNITWVQHFMCNERVNLSLMNQ